MSLTDIIDEDKMKKMTPSQKAKFEKKKLNAAKQEKIRAEAAARKAEKQKLKEEKRVEYLARQEVVVRESIAKLKREVSLEFDLKSIMPALEEQMKKHGEVERFHKSPIGARVRYVAENSVASALKAKKIYVKLPVPVFPAEIKHHAVYFNAPEDMGEIDDEILSQIGSAMEAYGKVVNCKKKGRSVVIFFAEKAVRDGLLPPEGTSEVTVEIGDHAVALHPGMPPNIRKRRKMAKLAKIEEKKATEAARAAGQPPPPKMIKSE